MVAKGLVFGKLRLRRRDKPVAIADIMDVIDGKAAAFLKIRDQDVPVDMTDIFS